MQILLALVIGAAIGLALEFLIPHRALRGAAIAPLIGAASAALVWTILTWAGVGLENPLLWLSAFVAPLVVTWPALVLISRRRIAHDQEERARLKIG